MADLTKKEVEDLALVVYRNAGQDPEPANPYSKLGPETQDVYRRIAVAVANKLGHSTPTTGLPTARE